MLSEVACVVSGCPDGGGCSCLPPGKTRWCGPAVRCGTATRGSFSGVRVCGGGADRGRPVACPRRTLRRTTDHPPGFTGPAFPVRRGRTAPVFPEGLIPRPDTSSALPAPTRATGAVLRSAHGERRGGRTAAVPRRSGTPARVPVWQSPLRLERGVYRGGSGGGYGAVGHRTSAAPLRVALFFVGSFLRPRSGASSGRNW